MNSSKITLNSCYTPGVYAATKAGLEAGSDALRVELASEEVSLLLICYKVSLCSRDRIFSDPRSPAWPRLHNRAHSSCQQVFHAIHLLFSFCAGNDLMQSILCFLLLTQFESQRQGLHYEAMSSNMSSQKDLEDFKKFSHIFSNCLPKPGLKIIELHSIYRYHWPAGLVSIGFK